MMTMVRARMRARKPLNERGFSLIELLVAVTILAIVLAGIYQGLGSLQTTTLEAQERVVNLDEARVLMATITKDLRTAARLTPTTSPFTYADGRHVTLYANINTDGLTGPNQVDIYVDANNKLIEKTITPQGTAPNYTYTSAPTTRVVGRWVANPGPLFTYYDAEGNELGGGGVLTSADLLAINNVRVELSIRRSPTLQAPPTTVINRVRLPNVDYNPLPEDEV